MTRKFNLPHRAWRSLADWIRAFVLRKTDTPYECYWRDRAFKAEFNAKALEALANRYREELREAVKLIV